MSVARIEINELSALPFDAILRTMQLSLLTTRKPSPSLATDDSIEGSDHERGGSVAAGSEALLCGRLSPCCHDNGGRLPLACQSALTMFMEGWDRFSRVMAFVKESPVRGRGGHAATGRPF